jgi:general secretion pathway protein A
VTRMYTDYFNLKENPFSISPDPRYLYMSAGHREALAHLLYGITSEGGFVLLTGEVGTGKTTICRRLLEQMPEQCDTAFILNPKLTALELLATICDEFQISYPEGTASSKIFVDRIYAYLLQAHENGRKAVLIIEEAQNLSEDTLEQLRLLTNLETNQRKLLQVIMVGQPELRDMLGRPQLRQLAQRISARHHLGPLTRLEIGAYVRHRLEVAGHVRGDLFPQPVLGKLYRLTGGVPRLINVICDRALLGACIEGKERVDRQILAKAAREVSGDATSLERRRRLYALVIPSAALVICAALVVGFYVHGAKQKQHVPDALRDQEAGAERGVSIPSPGTAAESPEGLILATTKVQAFSTLFKLWRIDYDIQDKRSACEQARAKGLECLERKGSLDSLIQMNRPAVLRLTDVKGSEQHATLVFLKGENASFAAPHGMQEVNVREIVRGWSGHYTLLWRPPPGHARQIRMGMRGPSVAWLDRQLALVQGREGLAVRQVYDQDMVRQVKEFQFANGLVPDGIVGPDTMIHLSGAAGQDGPFLRNKAGGG